MILLPVFTDHMNTEYINVNIKYICLLMSQDLYTLYKILSGITFEIISICNYNLFIANYIFQQCVGIFSQKIPKKESVHCTF